MALYISICLLAELAAISETTLEHGVVFEVVWGTTVGLALAHLFSFLLAGRWVEGRRIGVQTRATALAQMAGATGVAVVVSAVIIVVPTSVELNAARYDLAAVIAVIGYVIARRAAANKLRAALFAVAVAIVGLAVAGLKQWLAGH
jgi:dipeptide/tripeptide permease